MSSSARTRAAGFTYTIVAGSPASPLPHVSATAALLPSLDQWRTSPLAVRANTCSFVPITNACDPSNTEAPPVGATSPEA
jgi:hypothetical protein